MYIEVFPMFFIYLFEKTKIKWIYINQIIFTAQCREDHKRLHSVKKKI
jgi:hypothetical protein